MSRGRSKSLGALLAVSALSTGGVLCASAGPQAAVQAAPAQTRPNLLLVTLDDAARSDLRHMPFTRRLVGDAGVTMTNFIAPTPICVPSRASLLTGDYAHNHGLVTVGGPNGGASAFARSGRNRDTLATWLDDAGYDTFMTGKWMNGYERPLPASAAEPGWDRWEPATIGTYQFFATRFFDHGRTTGEPGAYSSNQITDRAERYLRARKGDGDPWFAWVNYVGPHHGGPHESDDPPGIGTTVPAPQDRDRFRRLRLPDKPNRWRSAKGSFGAEPRRQPTRRLKRGAPEAHRQRIEALQSIDRGIRRQVRVLARTGQLANTFVVVTSDNGYMLGEHNLVGKLFPYRESLNVPLLIRGPSLPRGRTVRAPASMADLGVTLAALAGAEPRVDKVDGTDFSGVLTDQRPLTRPIPIEGYRMRTRTGQRLYFGVIDGSWTYVRKPGARPHRREELYDGSNDPYELRNLAKRPAYQHRLEQLRALARALRDCEGMSCPKSYVPAAPPSDALR